MSNRIAIKPAANLSPYKKLKQQNENLQQDIYNILMKPNEAQGVVTRLSYLSKFKNEDLIWSIGLSDKIVIAYDRSTGKIVERKPLKHYTK